MADINRMNQRTRNQDKNYKLKTVEVIDLTDRENAAVVITAKRRVNNNTSLSEAQELRKAANKSPWTEDKKGRVFANKSTKRSTDDAVTQLQKFIGSLTRG